MSESHPKMYYQLADWWPLLSCLEDYEEEAGLFARAIVAARSETRSVLELGSGGGSNASHLKNHFTMTLVDLSPDMLEVSRALNPELPHHLGDMRDVRLGLQFDAVLIHDAIMYMTTVDDLRKAMQTAWIHCRPGGLVLFIPDFDQESFKPSTSHGGYDGHDRSLRYLEWNHDPDPGDTTIASDFAFLLREGDGRITVEHDRHILGLFPRATWIDLMNQIGLRPSIVPFDHSELEPGSYRGFLGLKPVD